MPVQILNLKEEVMELVVRKIMEMFNELDEKFYLDITNEERDIVVVESFLRMEIFYERLKDFDLEYLPNDLRSVHIGGQIINHRNLEVKEISNKNPSQFAEHILDDDLIDKRKEYRKYVTRQMSYCKKLIDVSRI